MAITSGTSIVGYFPQGGGAAQSSPTAASPKEVNFYDYNGALLHSYTLEETHALTELPEGPEHDGLVFQGWNCILGRIKYLDMPINVSAMYITDDGKTRLKIRIWDTARSNVPLYFYQSVDRGVTIDWGDGSAQETLNGIGDVNTAHQYGAKGDYTISLSVADGCTLSLGGGKYTHCVLGDTSNFGAVYCNLLQEANIGDGVIGISNYSFYHCSSLKSVTIPKRVSSIGNGAFNGCYALASVTIPNSTIRIGSNAFDSCYSLASVTIPDSGSPIVSSLAFRYCYSLGNVAILSDDTKIGHNAFYNCYSLARINIPNRDTTISDSTYFSCRSLTSVTIPERVTSIGSNAFYQCYGVAEYHIKPTTPPTLANANAFSGMASDCVIYVPVGCLEAYKTATNWATYADRMQEETE